MVYTERWKDIPCNCISEYNLTKYTLNIISMRNSCNFVLQSDLYYPRYLGVLNFGPKNRG